jgi:putative acetyltransferase
VIAASTVQIRQATIADIESIASILQDSFAEFEPFYTAAAYLATTPTAEQIRARWDDGPVWVGEQSGRLVGTVAVVPKASGLYVRSMAVHPAVRGHAIARKLLDEIENFAMEHHYQRLFLSTTPFLHAAIHVYERFGFQRTDNGPHDLFGTPLFTMEKVLSTTAPDFP